MTQYALIDNDGFFVEDVVLAAGETPTANHITPPPGGDSGRYRHRWNRGSGVWEEGAPTEVVAAAQLAAKLASIEDQRNRKLYSDVEVDFPSGPAVIQFRDERDRTNLSNVTTAAIALTMSGQGNTLIDYRTLDNVTQQVPASQFIAIAMTVLTAKQAVVKAAWQYKDTVRGLAAKELPAYDETAGW